MSEDDWKGGDGNWLTTGDWSSGSVPSSTDDVDLNGTRHVTITSSSDVTINSLEVDTAATLDITNDSTFDAINGLPFGVFGFISVFGAELEVANGTINNSSEIELTPNGTINADLAIYGTVALNGAGSIVLDGDDAGIIGVNGTSAFTNDDNNISGDGLIGSLIFTNDGTIETNTDDVSGASTLTITGNAIRGSFDNEGSVYADNGGTLVLGSTVVTTPVTITNNNTIELRSSGAVTTLEVANNLTITGSGQILLAGTDPANDEIVSNGHAASLTLNGQDVVGTGTLGDANLTLTIGPFTSVRANDNRLVINTGTNTIDNYGQIGAASETLGEASSFLDIQSPVQNETTGFIAAGPGGTVDFDAAGTTNEGTIGSAGSLTFFKSITNNGGVIEALNGGTITVDSSIIGLNNSQIDIGSDGLLDLAVGGTVSQGVTFTGPDAVLELDQNTGQIGTNISGIETSDGIDLRFLKLASGDHAVWVQAGTEGQVEVLAGNGSFLATVVLEGFWNTQDFALSADTDGDTVVGLLSPTVKSHFFKADRISDILFRSDGTGDTGFYQISNGANVGWQDIGASSTAYSVVGVGDFNGDGTSDILYRSAATGDTGFYAISNGTNAGWVDIGASSTAYSVVGVGDFTNSGTDDVLYRDNSTGDTGFYEIVNGANTGWVDIGASSTAYSVVGVGSFLGNNTDDILYRDNLTGDTGFYAIINGVNTGWHDIGPSSTAYSVVGTGDFFGTGTDDILFRDNSTGDTGFYEIVNGVNTGWVDIGASSTAYSVVATGDYLGTGTDDILFRSNSTGDTGFYAISNGVNTGWHDVGASSTAYHVVG
jgi:hypothetical protein